MAKKNKIVDMSVRWLVIAIIASVIATILGVAHGAIAESSEVWGGIFALLATAVILITSMNMKPGKESFMDILPTLLIVMAVMGIIGIVWADSPLDFVVSWSLEGLALAISAVVLAATISGKFLKSMRG
jgi:O-antigen/teichoic acid export membrane protein